MAIDLATGFNIGSKDAIDERQILTLEQMKNLDESIYPDKYFAICKDDGKLYLYDADNEINDETGKFREISGSDNTVGTDNFLKSYTELSQLGLSGDANVWDVIQALGKGEMAHIRTNGFTNASTLFPINDSGVLYIVKGNDDVYLHGTQVMWTSKQGGCAIGVIGSGSFDGWNVLSGSLSSNKKLIFNNRFGLSTYTLLAKIVLPDDSIYRHNIHITCAHKVNTSSGNWMFKENIDICKFDLHFTNPPLTSSYVNNPTMKLYGLTLYEYPFPEGTDEGIKKISENIRLYYDKTSYTIYVYLINNENLFAGKIGSQLIGLTVENKGDIAITESLLSDGVWNAPWNCQCELEDLEAPTIVKVGGDADEAISTTTTYTSLTQMGLTADATIDDVINALKEGETAFISTDEFTDYKNGMFPNQCTNDQYAVIKVEKEAGNRVFLEWRQKEGKAYAIGGLDNINKFTNWDNLVRFKKDGFADDSIVCIGDTVSNDGVIQTLATLGFSNDILTWDTGVYRVSHVSGLTNLPSDITSTAPAFRLEHHDCKKWGANHNPNTNTWAVRHSVLYGEGGKAYHRYTESGDTAGVYTKDTGWRVMAGAKHHRIVTQATGGYFKFKICDDPFSQPMRIIATDNYGGRIEITGAKSTSYKSFKCVRTSHGTYSSYDASNPTNNKMQKLYLYDGYFYLEVLSYSTVTFENLLEAPTYVETFENKDTEIPIIYLGSKTYTGIGQLNSAKGTSIQLVDNTDNTLKIIEVLGEGEEFVEWFGNTNDRFGLGADVGSRIDYLRIQKTNAANGIVLAVTDYGKTFTRSMNNGTLRDWCWDKSKATLVTNTTTLKLDVTKRNNGWYGAVKLTYLYDTSPVEVEITFRSATEDLRWAVINGQKYIKKITFTQDSSNTAHYTIGIEFSGTTYGNYQAEVIGGFADINSLTSEAFTGAKTAVYYSPWGKNNGVTLVSAPEDLGLTFPCTTVQLVQAMRDKFNKTITSGAIGVFNNGGKTVSVTDSPSDYGLLHIEVFGHDRLLIRYDGISGSTYGGSWIGQIKGSNGTFSGITWSRIDNDTRVTTLETQVSEIFQSFSDGKTLVANAITGKGVSTSTTATFATMATNISKISAISAYKEETKTYNGSGQGTVILTFSANVLAVKKIVSQYDSNYLIPSTSRDMFTIVDNVVYLYTNSTGSWQVTALIQA